LPALPVGLDRRSALGFEDILLRQQDL
jgi:hypothetical protein